MVEEEVDRRWYGVIDSVSEFELSREVEEELEAVLVLPLIVAAGKVLPAAVPQLAVLSQRHLEV